MSHGVWKTVACTFLLGVGISSAVLAAPTNEQIEQNIEARRQAREMEARRQAPHVSLGSPETMAKELPPLPVESKRFIIRHIQIETRQSSFHFLKDTLISYEGRLVGAEGVRLLAQVMTEKLAVAGYITSRVSVPEQDLSQGTLTFVIVPGRIEAIRFADPKIEGTWRTAFPTGKGSLLNLHSLEQGLEQMKQVPNQDVSMQLLPGTQPDTSVVELTVLREKPWSLGLSFDDGGADSTGRHEASVNGAIYDMAGLDDIFSWAYGKDAAGNDQAKGSDNYSFSYAVPMGNYTFSINTYKYKYHQTIADVTPYLSAGTTRGTEWELARVIHRDRTAKTSLFFRLIDKDRHNYINGEELAVQKQKTTAYRVGIEQQQYAGSTMADLQLWYQKGMPWMGAERNYGDSEPGNPTTRYSLWGLNASITAPVTIGHVQAQYRFHFQGQYTKDTLYSNDQLSIGGRWTVRGFDGEQNLSAENGFYIRNELDFPIEKWRITPYIGIDAGRVWGPSDTWLLGHTLAGAAAGIKGSIGRLHYDAFVSAPIHKPEGYKTGKTACGFSLYMEI